MHGPLKRLHSAHFLRGRAPARPEPHSPKESILRNGRPSSKSDGVRVHFLEGQSPVTTQVFVPRASPSVAQRASRLASPQPASARASSMDDGSQPHSEKLRELLRGERVISGSALLPMAKIGEGTFGVVYQCRLVEAMAGRAFDGHVHAGGMVAVKKLRSDAQIRQMSAYHSLTTSEIVEFSQEIALMRSLRHAHVLGYIGCGLYLDSEGHDQLSLVIEWAQHGSLAGLIGDESVLRRPYGLTDALRWVAEIASGLAFLHGFSPQVVHRDVKPENVLLCGPARVAKLADFGLATFERKRSSSAQSAAAAARVRRASGEDAGWEGGEASPPRRLPAASVARAPRGARVAPSSGPSHSGPDELAVVDVEDGGSDGSADGRYEAEAEESAGAAAAAPAEEVGSARAPGSPAPAAHAAPSELVGPTGSLRHMAPESFRGERYDHKVDQYSFGIVAHETLFRQRAHYRSYLTPLLIAQGAASASALRPKLPAKWPPKVCELLASCWHPDPERRPPFQSIAKQLAEWRADPHVHKRIIAPLAAGSSRGLLEVWRLVPST